ncbi:MAG: LamG-like jellyroll fold domain-containing protein, partial [Pseudomonadota bacterium]
TNALMGFVAIDSGAIGVLQQINTTTAFDQSGAVLAEVGDGRIFAAWYDDSDGDNTNLMQVRGQFINPDGTLSGSELTIGATDAEGNNAGEMPPLTATLTANGDVFVAWQGDDSFNTDGTGASVLSALVRTATTAGADILSGEAGNDRLIGGNASDQLSGGIGDDVLVGDVADYQFQVTDLDPVAYYKLDDTNGVAIDSSSNGNDGTYFGNPLRGESGAIEEGTAVLFNGVNSTMEVADNAVLDLAQGTFSFWFNTTNPAEQGLLSIDQLGTSTESHLSIYINASGSVRVRTQHDGAETNSVVGSGLADGNWHHVAFTFDSSGTRVFLNGSQVDADTRVFDLIGTNEPMVIGATIQNSGDGTSATPSLFFSGLMDEVAVFDRALDTQTIETLYEAGANITTTGVDTLIGGAGDDVLMGGADDDTLGGGAGADVLSGGRGADTVSYFGALSGVDALFADTDAGGFEGVAYINETAGGKTGDAAGDSYSSIEAVIGSAFNDRIYGADGGMQADLGDGDDMYENRATNDAIDRVSGGLGNDIISTGGGNDLLNGGAGNDRLAGEGGDDIANGGADDDILFGGAGNDTLNGDGGNDLLSGGAGADALNGGSGTDTVSYLGASAGVDALFTTTDAFGIDGDYTNTVAGGQTGDAAGDTYSSIEAVTGSAFDDRFFGTNTGMTVDLGDGNDIYETGSSNNATDTVDGGAGNDRIFTGDGDDVLNGGADNDTLDGEGGNDTLNGGDGDDTLFGQSGNDTLDGGAGTDAAGYTGASSDYTIMDNGDGTHTVTDNRAISGNEGADILRNIEQLNFLDGTFGINAIDVASPIVFDMDNSGAIETTGAGTARDRDGLLGETVEFDMDGDGLTESIEWISGTGDAFLVDNTDGLAATDMNGTRLFGDQDGTYDHGYEQLALHDVDGSGAIEGAELDALALWQDDGDAKVQEGELLTLTDMGIERIELTLDQNAQDAAGRDLFRSTATLHDGSTMMTEDVWFARKVDADEEETKIVPESIQLTPHEELLA